MTDVPPEPGEVPTFRAWALPADAALPGTTGTYDVEGGAVAHPEPGPEWMEGLAGRLRAAAAELRDLPTQEVVAALGRVGERLLDPGDPVRREALAWIPRASGLSRPMAEAVLDGMAADWTPDRLAALLERAFPGGSLDGFVEERGRRVRVVGPELAVQVVAGSVPGVGATALLRSLLVKGPTLVKPGRGDPVLPVLAARIVADAHPVLGRGAAVLYWPGGRAGLEGAALGAADVVVAYGGDEAVGALRRATPVTARFTAYHHRVSLAVLGRDALAPGRVEATAAALARAVALFDQRGCVSPQAVYVERGGGEGSRAFARRLAGALEELEEALPGGSLDAAEGSALHQLRGTVELLAASGREGLEAHHGGGASWTVVHDPDPAFDPSCVGRVVRVKPVADLAEVPGLLAPWGRHLQTVALEGAGDRDGAVSEALARVGVSRMAPLAGAAFPPPWWHHDGLGALEPLVRRVDRELP